MKKALSAVFALVFAAGITSSVMAVDHYQQCRQEKPKKYCHGTKVACEKKGCSVIQTIQGKPVDHHSSKVFIP
jgi:hypothetical protein